MSHLLRLSLVLVFFIREVDKPASVAFRFLDVLSEVRSDRTGLRGRRCRRGGEAAAW